jgi:hypothetical protein
MMALERKIEAEQKFSKRMLILTAYLMFTGFTATAMEL